MSASLLEQVKNASKQAQKDRQSAIVEEENLKQKEKITDKARGKSAAIKEFPAISQKIIEAAQKNEKYYDIEIYSNLANKDLGQPFYIAYEEKLTELLKSENFNVKVDTRHNDSSGTYEYYGHEVNDKWLSVTW